MSVDCTAILPSEGENEGLGTSAGQGALVCEEGAHVFIPLTDTAALTQATFQFLCDINTLVQKQELDVTATLITNTEVEIFREISSLQEALGKLEVPENHLEQGQSQRVGAQLKQQTGAPTRTTTTPVKQAEKFSSIFSMARAMSPQKGPGEAKSREPVAPLRREALEEFIQSQKESSSKSEERRFREKDQDKGSAQDQKQDQEDQPKKDKKRIRIEEVQTSHSRKTKKYSASTGSSPSAGKSSSGGGKTPEIGNIYVRFMALMARILGQAEAEAHSLYLKIKKRTDDIETLTNLAGKINSESGKIDWSKDEEMKKLVERARELGVDIPEGKYTWTEDEKKLLKENIQMRKDNFEKITQLERTDMQRYLQEATHCHQARSNILKLLKEVIDTFVHNIRPG